MPDTLYDTRHEAAPDSIDALELDLFLEELPPELADLDLDGTGRETMTAGCINCLSSFTSFGGCFACVSSVSSYSPM